MTAFFHNASRSWELKNHLLFVLKEVAHVTWMPFQLKPGIFYFWIFLAPGMKRRE